MMLKEGVLKDIKIEKGLTKEMFMEGSGKLINVFVEFNEESSSTVKIRIRTKIGESVLNVSNINKEQTEVFYPRLNSTAGREHQSIMPEDLEASSEYYYFKSGLLLEIEKDNLGDKGTLIKELIVLYEQ